VFVVLPFVWFCTARHLADIKWQICDTQNGVTTEGGKKYQAKLTELEILRTFPTKVFFLSRDIRMCIRNVSFDLPVGYLWSHSNFWFMRHFTLTASFYWKVISDGLKHPHVWSKGI
jgi:hypothetical protein